MDKLKKIISLISFNFRPIILFVFINTILVRIITEFFSKLFFGLSQKASGLLYIGNNNLIDYLLSPITILSTILLIVIMGFLIYFEISAFCFAFHMSEKKEKTTFRSMVNVGFVYCGKIFNGKNILFFLFIVLLMPIVSFLTLSNSMMSVNIPEFIHDFIMNNDILRVLFIALCVLLLIISIRLTFSLHIFSLKKGTIVYACKESKKLNKGNAFKTLIYFIACSIFAIVIIALISAIIIGVGTLIYGIIKGMNQVSFDTCLEYFKNLSILLIFFITPPFMLAAISTLYYDRAKKADYETENVEIIKFNKPVSKKTIIAYIAIIVLILAGTGYERFEEFEIYTMPLTRPLVGAHRGDSTNAPENSMPAFKLAIEENAPWVELDVHQTKDDVIIISHDDNISRVSGKDICVHDTNYSELKELDVGSWFSDKFSYVRFSTLDEVLKTFKPSNTNLQIEIKPTDFDRKIEQRVLDIIKENDMSDRVIITSLKDEPLKKVKELSPESKTAYNMAIAFGNIEQIEFSDHLCVEASNITPGLVAQIHEQGKQCFVWTINSPNDVQRLLDCGVDTILSDNPILINQVLDDCDYSSGLSRYIRLHFSN